MPHYSLGFFLLSVSTKKEGQNPEKHSGNLELENSKVIFTQKH